MKSGKTFLKEYYLKHRALSEKDLDNLVAKSNMSYEQVRDWFSETARKVEEGKEPFSDERAEEGEGDDEEEEEEEVATAQCADSEGEMEVREQGEASDNDSVGHEKKEPGDDEEVNEEEEEEEDEVIQEESEGGSQSQPQAEAQT